MGVSPAVFNQQIIQWPQGWVLGPYPRSLTGICCPPPRPRGHSLHSLHFLLGHHQEAPPIRAFREQLLATMEEGMEEATREGMQGIMGTPDILDMDTTTIHCRGCMARQEATDLSNWQKKVPFPLSSRLSQSLEPLG